MIAIKTIKLSKSYGDFKAVNNLDLEINQGELFSLLGGNGAGKTTTIKILSCLLAPSSGTATLLGDNIQTDTQKVKEKTNISPQENAVAPNLPVGENLELIARVYGKNKKEARVSVDKMLTQFKLTDVRNKKSKHLSGGMQRRLSIAMALISDPEILFLDEPTLGLDITSRRELWQSIKNLKGKVTILHTSHHMEEIEELSDRVGIMAEGNLVATGSVDELKRKSGKNNFEDAFISISGGNL